MRNAIVNGVEFPKTVLKCVYGEIPKSIKGTYYRNGPSVFNYGNEVLDHWFNGSGGIIKLGFNAGPLLFMPWLKTQYHSP